MYEIVRATILNYLISSHMILYEIDIVSFIKIFKVNPISPVSSHLISSYLISSYHMSYSVMSSYLTPYHLISSHITLCHIILCYIILYHIVSSRVVSYHIISYNMVNWFTISKPLSLNQLNFTNVRSQISVRSLLKFWGPTSTAQASWLSTVVDWSSHQLWWMWKKGKWLTTMSQDRKYWMLWETLTEL